jgi:hypothetical protein
MTIVIEDNVPVPTQVTTEARNLLREMQPGQSIVVLSKPRIWRVS